VERQRGANRNDRQTVDAVAQEKNMTQEQRRAFGSFIEDVKRSEGRGGADNFTYEELLDLADEFLEIS
jgi:hypothetical protein